jgi:hypothetical protein
MKKRFARPMANAEQHLMDLASVPTPRVAQRSLASASWA